jgi:dolichol-phosphate mannosyltransferase
LRFSRNFGHQAALTAGLKHAVGQAVIVMDSDLQHPPELISEMVKMWRQGTHVVHTIRSYGNEIGWFKRYSSDCFYALCNLVSEIKFIPGAADFRLMDRAVVECFNAMPEQSRFLRGMIRWLGFNETSLNYTAQPRTTGVSKFNFWKMFSFAADGITSFSVLPLRWITACGLAVAAISLCYAVYVLGEVLVTGITAPGWPTLIVAILFLGGMQLTAIGIVGEYVGRIYMETKRRPLFVVQDKLGFNVDEQAHVEGPATNRKMVA